MGLMSQWLVSISVMLFIGVAGTVYFFGIVRPRDETDAGIVALSGTSWRQFLRTVLGQLALRGFRTATDLEGVTGGESDLILTRDGEQWLLSCKHGSAFVLGIADVQQLADDMRMKNASGGFLVTQGRIEQAAYPIAASQQIELLDGRALWPLLRGAVPADQRKAIVAESYLVARRRTLLAWLLALLAAVAAFALYPSGSSTPEQAAPSPPAMPPAVTPATPAGAAVATEVPVTTTDPAVSSTTEEQAATPAEDAALSIAEQRDAVVAAISTLPEVDRVIWESQSTLHVFLAAVDGDAFERICPLMERHPDIASSRIQLSASADSGQRVRFRQCRSY
ncbi:restriction endonuclease [Luteimonas sp. RIT-PG2_3]